MSAEEFPKGVEQEESASRQRQFESHEATASALAEQELATTQHESSAAQREPPATEQDPLAVHDQHNLADEAIVSNRLVLPSTFHSFVWVHGVDGWGGWMGSMDGVDGWGGWMGWMDGVDGWGGWMGWMDGVDG